MKVCNSAAVAAWRRWVAGCACWLATGLAWPQEAIPTERFFAPPDMSEGVTSPEGTHLALIIGSPGQRRRLVVMDVQSMAAKVAAGFQDGDVVWATWVNDTRLLIRVQSGNGFTVDSLHAVDRDGTNLTNGFDMLGRFAFVNPSQANDDVYLVSTRYDNRRNFQRNDLVRLNTRTLVRTPVPLPGDTIDFVLDAGAAPLALLTREPPGRATWYREPGGEWRKLAAFELYAADAIVPVAPGPAESQTLFVRAQRDRETSALHLFDLKANRLDPQPVLAVSGYDFKGGVLRRNGAVIGVHYQGDTLGVAWLDPTMRAMQEKVDALLPRTQNDLSVGQRHKTSKWLVFAHSDVEPGQFLLYDSESGTLTPIGPARRGVEPRRMARVDVVRFPARDGLSIPARVTLPPGGGARPHALVVLAKQDPWNRSGAWGWDAPAQFLAARGYAVLQIEQRGTFGYGRKLFEAGWKQFGLAMQDDLVDGVKWAVAQGIADPQRVCIAGFDYGGYAALMALARDASTFRCGAAFHAITDLEANVGNFLAFNEEYRAHGIGRLIGDAEADAAQLRATSPVHRAADIRQPLLMGAWDGDRAIPFQHAGRMRDALQKAGARLEWHPLPEVKTPAERLAQTVALWDHIAQFLATHNPPGAAGATTAPAAAAPKSPP